MRVAYIANEVDTTARPVIKRPAKKTLRQISLEALEARYAVDKLNAINRLKPEYEVLRKLEEKLHSLKQKTK